MTLPYLRRTLKNIDSLCANLTTPYSSTYILEHRKYVRLFSHSIIVVLFYHQVIVHSPIVWVVCDIRLNSVQSAAVSLGLA